MTSSSKSIGRSRWLLVPLWSLLLSICASCIVHAQASPCNIASEGEEALDPFAPLSIDSYRLTREDLHELAGDTADRVEIHEGVMLVDNGTCATDLALRRGGEWICFSVPLDAGSIEYGFVDLDGEGDDELVLRGGCGYYGSGGGASEHMVAIYRIDTSVVRLFEAVDEFTEEAFARPYNRHPGILRHCERAIGVSSGKVRVAAVVRSRRGGDACGCLTPIPEGLYRVHEGALVRVAERH